MIIKFFAVEIIHKNNVNIETTVQYIGRRKFHKHLILQNNFTLFEMRVVNKPFVSRYVASAYGILVVFIAVLIVFFIYAAVFTPMGTSGFVAAIGVAVVELIMLSILMSLYHTRYVLSDDELLIETTKFIGGTKRVARNEIESIETTLIPFGIKLFGASFHGGYYEIPSLGRAFLAITNYRDGLLIKTSQGNYIITPSDPLDFKKALHNPVEMPRKNPSDLESVHR